MAFGLGLGRLGLTGGARWTPAQLWPLGASSPGMWIDPPYTASMFQDSAGTTAISAIGTVLDTSNPVGLALDRKGGAAALADPGIHLLQATATSRPVASARVNLLTYSEDFSNAVWYKEGLNPFGSGSVANTTATTDPIGGNTADFIQESTAAGTHQVTQTFTVAASVRYTQSVRLKAAGRSWCQFVLGPSTFFGFSGIAAYFDISSGVVGTVTSSATALPEATITPLGDDWYECTMSATSNAAAGVAQAYVRVAQNGSTVSYTGDGTSGLYIWGAQLNTGSTALPYQRVNTASDYDASAGPTYTKLDGTDDGWLSATFTADTDFTDGMDALIAVRRDSAANAVCGLYQSVAEANKVFGIAESGSGSGCVGSGAGTPTVLVDGTQLAGGTAVTRGTLHTALTPGDWHILEFRNLDLSTWTAVGFGLYTSYVLNGTCGEIQVFSNGQDANRDKARAQMAAYFGVTLP